MLCARSGISAASRGLPCLCKVRRWILVYTMCYIEEIKLQRSQSLHAVKYHHDVSLSMDIMNHSSY